MGLFKSIGKIVGKVAGPVLSGAGTIFGGTPGKIFDAAGSYLSAQQAYSQDQEAIRQANAFSAASTQRQMDFQERMYGQRYQAQMADMRAAGLNPILSYQQGAPGGPAGASYTAQPETGGQAAVTTASQTRRSRQEERVMRATMKRVNQEVLTSKASEADLRQGAFLKNNLSYQAIDQAHLNRKAAEKIEAETAIAKQNLQSAKAAAAAAKHEEAFFKTPYGRAIKNIDLTGRGLNPFANSAKSAKGAL